MAKKSVTTVNNHNLNTSKNRLYSSTENIPHELRPQNTSESNTNYSPMFSSISDLTNSVEKPMKDKKNKWYKKILTFNTNSLKTENENKKKKKWNWKKPIPVIAE